MRHFALSAIGRDRPGIVAAIARVLFEHGVNIEDSQMTILRGHFTMTLIVTLPDVADEAQLRSAIDRAGALMGLEAHTLSEVTEAAGDAPDPTHIVSVYGADHPGIVNAVSSALAENAINITDLNTRLLGEDDLYVMMLEVALPDATSGADLQQLLLKIAGEQGVDVTVRELENDEL